MSLATKAAGTPLLYTKDAQRLQVHNDRVFDLRGKKYTEMDLLKKFAYTANAERPADNDSGDMNRKMVGELFDSGAIHGSMVPTIQKAILDSTGGYTSGGSVFIRQDLEPYIHELFVSKFPWWEMMASGASNGLVHVANQITATDSNALGATAISETGAITYVSGVYNRASYPIMILGTGRGVTFKEMAATVAGGGTVQPLETELRNGIIALARDAQFYLFQGNATNTSSTTTTSEGGAYNSITIDGLRGVTGSVGSFAGNGAVQIDQIALTLTDSLIAAASRLADNGGTAKLALMTKRAKAALDTENNGNKRYNDAMTDVVAGVRANTIACVDGDVPVLSVPGNTIGAYVSPTTGAYVEDVYVLDTDHITRRWLYSPTFTVLEIPSGVDGILSSRYLVFVMFGNELAAPPFLSKIRRTAA